MRTEIVNAQIESTYVGGWDASAPPPLGANMTFMGDGRWQGTGYYDGGRVEAFMTGVLSALEVSNWERLPKTFCRIRREDGLIVAVGHLLKDQWFAFASIYAAPGEAKGESAT